MTIRYKTRNSWGNVLQHEIPNVAIWTDETSKVDPYTLRIMRDSAGRILAGPMVGEFFDFEVL